MTKALAESMKKKEHKAEDEDIQVPAEDDGRSILDIMHGATQAAV